MTEEAPSQLDKIITNGYKGLGLEYFFTAGHDEVRVSQITFGTHRPFVEKKTKNLFINIVLGLDYQKRKYGTTCCWPYSYRF